MDKNLVTAYEIAEKVRFPREQRVQVDQLQEFSNQNFINTTVQSDFPITEELTPELYQVLKKTCDHLNLDVQVIHPFVYPSTTIQAQLISVNTSDCLIRVSSGLIEILEEDEISFVLGHEIGHFLLEHGVYHFNFGNESIENLLIKRAQEVSADRIGYLACGSLEGAIKALMKTASGLSDRYLRFDVGSYLSHLREVDEGFISNSTHPSILFRCRALLWFSMHFKDYSDVINQKQSKLDNVNRKVEVDLDRFIDAPAIQKIDATKSDLSLWVFVKLILSLGKFDKEKQQLFQKKFGDEYLVKVLRLFEHNSIEDLNTIVNDNVEEKKRALEGLIPMGFTDEYERLVTELKELLQI